MICQLTAFETCAYQHWFSTVHYANDPNGLDIPLHCTCAKPRSWSGGLCRRVMEDVAANFMQSPPTWRYILDIISGTWQQDVTPFGPGEVLRLWLLPPHLTRPLRPVHCSCCRRWCLLRYACTVDAQAGSMWTAQMTGLDWVTYFRFSSSIGGSACRCGGLHGALPRPAPAIDGGWRGPRAYF